MGVHAVRAALADAGIAWSDVQVAFGGSEDAGNADTMVADLGPTGIPFVNVRNGCATGGSSLVAAVRALESGAADVALVVGFDKHPRGAFQNDPADWSLPDWYGRIGLMVTTQFFGAKLQRYMHDHAIPVGDAGAGRREGVRERRADAARLAPPAALRRRDPRLARCSRTRSPSTCSARRAKAPRRSCSAGASTCRGPGGAGGAAAVGGLPHAPRGHVRGLQPVAAARDRALTDGRRGAGGLRDGRGRARPTSTSSRCRTPSRGRS